MKEIFKSSFFYILYGGGVVTAYHAWVNGDRPFSLFWVAVSLISVTVASGKYRREMAASKVRGLEEARDIATKIYGGR